MKPKYLNNHNHALTLKKMEIIYKMKFTYSVLLRHNENIKFNHCAKYKIRYRPDFFLWIFTKSSLII